MDIFDSMKKMLLLLLIGTFNLTFAQGEKTITGKISVADAKASGVTVLNLNTEKETQTDSLGRFEISVSVDDLLIFYAPHLDKMRKLIDEEAYNSKEITIEMTSKITELDEVVITNYSHINAFNLGIIQKPIPLLTPAERGKYRSEPRAEEFEIKLSTIAKLEALYDTSFFEKQLKIEKGMAKGFLFYATDHEWFMAVAKGKNKMLTTFYLTMLAQKYNESRKNTSITKNP